VSIRSRLSHWNQAHIGPPALERQDPHTRSSALAAGTRLTKPITPALTRGRLRLVVVLFESGHGAERHARRISPHPGAEHFSDRWPSSGLSLGDRSGIITSVVSEPTPGRSESGILRSVSSTNSADIAVSRRSREARVVRRCRVLVGNSPTARPKR